MEKGSFDFTLKYMMLQFPYVFDSKFVACDHLFMVVGNGYDWVDGTIQPSEGFPENINFVRLAELSREKVMKNKNYSEIAKKRCIFVIENVDLLIHESFSNIVHYGFYGIHNELSLCTTIPKNIKEDWRRALFWFMRCYKLFLSKMKKGKIKIDKRSYEAQMFYTENILRYCEELSH